MDWNPTLRRQRTAAGDGGFLRFSRWNRRAPDRNDLKFSRVDSTSTGTYSLTDIGSKWRAFWKSIRRKRKIVSYQYDSCAYLQNFDDGPAWSPEDGLQLPRSFSARFADPVSFIKGRKERKTVTG